MPTKGRMDKQTNEWRRRKNGLFERYWIRHTSTTRAKQNCKVNTQGLRQQQQNQVFRHQILLAIWIEKGMLAKLEVQHSSHCLTQKRDDLKPLIHTRLSLNSINLWLSIPHRPYLAYPRRPPCPPNWTESPRAAAHSRPVCSVPDWSSRVCVGRTEMIKF